MMQPSEGILASDADRDAAASALADAVAAGRLSLEEHNAGSTPCSPPGPRTSCPR